MVVKHGVYLVTAKVQDTALRYLLSQEQKGKVLLQLDHQVFLTAAIKVIRGVNYLRRAFML